LFRKLVTVDINQPKSNLVAQIRSECSLRNFKLCKFNSYNYR